MIKNAKRFNLKGQRLWLLPQKAVFWQKKKTLLIADLHIGKSGHFRRNGIRVPQKVNTDNLEILDELVDKIDPVRIIFLGDLFHSKVNEEWNQFKTWRRKHPNVEVTLVIGNHDILPLKLYHNSYISVFKRLKLGPFLFVHDVEQFSGNDENQSYYLLGGHVHPAIKLSGKGRQKMKLPCFYFGDNAGILPAFGQFTGTAVIKPSASATIFIIADNQVLQIRNNLSSSNFS